MGKRAAIGSHKQPRPDHAALHVLWSLSISLTALSEIESRGTGTAGPSWSRC